MKTTLFMLIFFIVTTATALAQVCRDDIPASTPRTRFLVNDNGTVSDTATGLTWKRCSEGQSWDGTSCTGNPNHTYYTWQQALQLAESTSFAGQTDWRLPNIKELASLIEQRCYDPSINEDIFPNTLRFSGYWSSTPSAGISDRVLVGNFGYGSTGSDHAVGVQKSVRLVRGQ